MREILTLAANLIALRFKRSERMDTEKHQRKGKKFDKNATIAKYVATF